MHLSTYSAEQRLLRITHRARAISAVPPRHRAAARPHRNAEPLHQPEDNLSADSGQSSVRNFTPGDGIEGSRRRAPRTNVSGEVSVRRTGGFNFQAGLRDVSIGGCRVELIEPTQVGDHVITRFPALEPLGARVCWSAGVTAGVEFHAPVHPAVFDALLVRLQVSAA